MPQEPFRFEDVPSEVRLVIYDQLSFPGIQGARFTSPIGTPFWRWKLEHWLQLVLQKLDYEIYVDDRPTQQIPPQGFYANDIIALGRQYGNEFNHRIQHTWLASAEPIWNVECVSIFTYRWDDDRAGIKGCLRYLDVPRTFQTAPNFVRVSVRMFMDEALMMMPWEQLDDETSNLSVEMIYAHSEMMTEIGGQHQNESHDMTRWNRSTYGTDQATGLRVVIDCYSRPIPEGGSEDRDGASLWSAADLIAYGRTFPRGMRYYPVPAATIRRCIDDLCSIVWERYGRCNVYLDGELCSLGEEDFRPAMELSEGRMIDDIAVTYSL